MKNDKSKLREEDSVIIADVIKSFISTSKKLSKLDKQICDYCLPKIEEAKKLKDIDKLQNLLNYLPAGGIWGLFIYQAMEEIRNSL